MFEALIYLLDNIYIRFDTKLYRQIVGIPMGTNCAPLVAGLFLFCYERDFMTSLSDVKQAKIIEAFKSTSRYQGWISRNVLKHGISLVLRYVLCSYLSLFYL